SHLKDLTYQQPYRLSDLLSQQISVLRSRASVGAESSGIYNVHVLHTTGPTHQHIRFCVHEEQPHKIRAFNVMAVQAVLFRVDGGSKKTACADFEIMSSKERPGGTSSRFHACVQPASR